MKLAQNEVKVLKFVMENPDSAETAIAEATGIHLPNVSAVVKKLEEVGALITRKEGKTTLVRVTEDVKFTAEDEIIIPSGISDPFLANLEVALHQNLDKASKRNIDAIMRLIERDLDNVKNNPWALEDTLNLFNVPQRNITIIERLVYGGERLNQLKQITPAPQRPVTTPTSPTTPTTGGVVYTTGGQGPQIKIDIAELAKALREPAGGQPGGSTVTLPGERVIERRIEMETITQPVLDKEGKPITGPDGKPLMQQIQRPMVIMPQTQTQPTQWTPKDMYENLVKPIIEQFKPKSAETEKTVDEDKLADKVSDKLKGSVDEVKGSVAEVKKRMEDMEQRWEREKAYWLGYEEAVKKYGGGGQSLEQYKLNIQKDLLEKSVITELRETRGSLRDFALLHYAAILEERRGMIPGTLLQPLMRKLGVGEILPQPEVEIQPTTEAEKRAFLAKLKAD